MSLWLALHLGVAIYFASIIVSGGLYYAGGTVLSPLRTKAFCLPNLALMQVELEGHGLCVLQLYGTFWLGLKRLCAILSFKVSHTII